jgi:serine O-acetyltransferase
MVAVKIKIKYLYNTKLSIRILLFVPYIIYIYVFKILTKVLPGYFYSYLYFHTSKVYRMNDLTISIKELGRKKTKLPHPIGIVIGEYVKIGKQCIIYQNVTIGAKSQSGAINKKYPQIGDNVYIGTHAVIIGDIKIGNNVVIGAATFVNKDIPDNTVVVGNPFRIINYLSNSN